MKLSDILKESQVCNSFRIDNDREFDYFCLSVADIPYKACVFLDREEFLDQIRDNVVMIITDSDIAKKINRDKFGICIVDNPRNTFFKLHNYMSDKRPYARENYKTKIGNGCKISESAVISDNNVTIGNNVIIEEFVVIRENTCIGDDCIIRSGVKLGGSDFEFKREGDSIFSVIHCGGLKIGANVEVQYNTGINKALYPWDDTVIGDYSKIDMLVHIAHGVKIGHGTMIVANSGIGGRTEIGNNCWIGFGATIRNGIRIGNNARVNMGAVVSRSVADNGSVTGNFAISHDKFMTNLKNSL